MRISALRREANLFVKEQIRVGTALACILRKLIEQILHYSPPLPKLPRKLGEALLNAPPITKPF